MIFEKKEIAVDQMLIQILKSPKVVFEKLEKQEFKRF